jgi:hypothetical protein
MMGERRVMQQAVFCGSTLSVISTVPWRSLRMRNKSRLAACETIEVCTAPGRRPPLRARLGGTTGCLSDVLLKPPKRGRKI